MICPDCGREFDPDEEQEKFDELVKDISDWPWDYSGRYCAECDYEEACSAEGGIDSPWD